MIFNINSTRGHTGSLLVSYYCCPSIYYKDVERYNHVALNVDVIYSSEMSITVDEIEFAISQLEKKQIMWYIWHMQKTYCTAVGGSFPC